jgi:hypothetical protein
VLEMMVEPPEVRFVWLCEFHVADNKALKVMHCLNVSTAQFCHFFG